MDVSVIGLGKLGLPLAAALHKRGFDVIGVDKNEQVLDSVHYGKPLHHEPGVANWLGFDVTMHTADAIDHTDTTIIIVGTPSRSDGGFSLEWVLPACEQVGAALADKDGYHLVIISSTVMPGATGGVIREILEQYSGKQAGPDFGLCYVPEFVALGEVVEGFIYPDFVLVGAIDDRAGWYARELYRRFTDNYLAPIHTTSLVNAELAKIALNCYLTTKISFANQLAWICEGIPGADVDEVTAALGLDSRVSNKYLTGATSYGGPCFPRDDCALQTVARAAGASVALVSAVSAFNKAQLARLIMRTQRELDALGKHKRLGVLGLAFKPGTDCTTASVGMELVERLGDYCPVAYDLLVRIAESGETAQQVVDVADVVVVTTTDPAFERLQFHKGQTVIDCWRILERAAVEDVDAKYVGIGLGHYE